jgi:hypothetical protein
LAADRGAETATGFAATSGRDAAAVFATSGGGEMAAVAGLGEGGPRSAEAVVAGRRGRIGRAAAVAEVLRSSGTFAGGAIASGASDFVGEGSGLTTASRVPDALWAESPDPGAVAAAAVAVPRTAALTTAAAVGVGVGSTTGDWIGAAAPGAEAPAGFATSTITGSTATADDGIAVTVRGPATQSFRSFRPCPLHTSMPTSSPPANVNATSPARLTVANRI